MALSANDAFAARRRGRRGRRGRAALSEINVTPLVDVMLVLLIIFMISAPLLTAGVKVDLPKTEAGALQDQAQPVTVTVQADGSLFLSETAIRLGDLRTALATIAEKDGTDRPVYVRADGRAPYAMVAQAMAVLSTSGFTHINLITDTGKVEGPPQAPAR
ncbi:MAG: protein TolR [Caulobacteraceae bacterium]|nr:protein TolR [Caulobacteraceae bacterium]